MFKRTLIAISMAALLATSLPSEAKFGGGSHSSSSSHSSSHSSYSAPSRPSGGLSSGGNIGMQRQAVTRPATAPTRAPTYNPTSSYNYRPAYQNSNHYTVVHHYSPSTGGGGFGMGSLAMAAMGGYMLNGIMHDHSGAVYNGSGYTNGVPTQGGQYYTQPQVGDVQQAQPQVQQPMDSIPQNPQVIYQQVPVESGIPTWVKVLLWISGITFFIAFIRRVFL